MEPEGSSLLSQKPIIEHYPELVQSTSHFHALFL